MSHNRLAWKWHHVDEAIYEFVKTGTSFLQYLLFLKKYHLAFPTLRRKSDRGYTCHFAVPWLTEFVLRRRRGYCAVYFGENCTLKKPIVQGINLQKGGLHLGRDNEGLFHRGARAVSHGRLFIPGPEVGSFPRWNNTVWHDKPLPESPQCTTVFTGRRLTAVPFSVHCQSCVSIWKVKNFQWLYL